MIVKNEEAVLARCLESAAEVADEIIIVDTGSTDRTKEIAAGFTDKIFDFKWADDFSAARNFSFSKGHSDYLMWLDADDVILPADREKILRLKTALPPDADAVLFKYALGFDESGNPNFMSTRGRLFRRAAHPTWHDQIHEYVPLIGKIHKAEDIFITHRPAKDDTASDRNLKIYASILKTKGTLDPRGKYYYARELKDHGQYKKSAQMFEAFLKEGLGWKEDNICACFNLALCYKALAMPARAHAALLKSFNYDAPRAEICCLLGYHYKETLNFAAAAAWFETALGLPKNDGIGFVSGEYGTFIPAIEGAVCRDKLGQYERANELNERAGAFKPSSPQVLHNRAYFAEKLKSL